MLTEGFACQLMTPKGRLRASGADAKRPAVRLDLTRRGHDKSQYVMRWDENTLALHAVFFLLLTG